MRLTGRDGSRGRAMRLAGARWVSRARAAQKPYEKTEWAYFAHPNEGLKLHLGAFTDILRGRNSRGAMRLAGRDESHGARCVSRAREAQKTYEKAEWAYFAHPNEGLKLHLGAFTDILRGQ